MITIRHFLFTVSFGSLALLLLPLLSLAEATTSTTTSITTSTSSTSTIAATTTEEAPPKPEGTPGALSTVAQDRISKLAANMSNKMDAAVKRLQNVHDRLDSRLTLLTNDGLDTTSARQSLNETQKQLDSARSALANIDNNVAAFLHSSNPQENWLEVKREYTDIAATIVTAHGAIITTIENASQATPVPTTATTSTSTPTL